MKVFMPFLLCVSLLLLSSCQSEEQLPQPSSDTQELTFSVTNYYQYGFPDITRADAAEKLAHLAFAVFDADADTLVIPIAIQDRGSEGYGTFKVSLPQGKYRLLFLGYDGNRSLLLTSSRAVAFAEDYVPHTFMYSTILQVGPSMNPSFDIVLRRVVAAFRLSLLDAIPDQVQRFCMKSDVGGAVLNAQTGFCSNSSGRTAYISIPSDSHSKPGIYLTYYLYLPSTETVADLTLSALDAEGKALRSRTFSQVPMAVNRLTVYEGEFFSEDSFNSSSNITVDYDWSDTLSVKF